MPSMTEPAKFEAGPRTTLTPVLVQVIGTGALLVLGQGASVLLLVVLTLSGLATVLLLVRSAFPDQAKAVLAGLVAVELLALVATSDVFGMHEVDRKIDRAVEAAGQPDPLEIRARASRPVVERQVSVSAEGPGGGAMASHLARELDPVLVPGVTVSGKLTSVRTSNALLYSLNWSVVRDAKRIWCGTLSVDGDDDAAAADAMAEMIADQLDGPSGTGEPCAGLVPNAQH